MKLQKSIALGAGVCALALTAITTPIHLAHAAETTTQTTNTTGIFKSNPQTVKINYNANFGIAIWSEPDGSATGKFVPGQTSVKVSGSQIVNGKTWYLLADNSGWIDGQFVTSEPAKETTTSSITTNSNSVNKVTDINEIVTIGTNGAPVYSDTNVSAKTSRVLANGSHWKAFSRIEDGDNVWYNLGGKQYVLASDLSNNASQSQTSTPAKSETVTKSINSIIEITNANGAAIYTKPDSNTKTNRILRNGSHWKAFKTADNGSLWINLGGNQWILASDSDYSTQGSTTSTDNSKASTTTSTASVKTTGTVRINYKPGYGIAVWSQPGNHIIKGKYLKHGTSWKFFATTTVNGHTWYNLGGNQWIDGAFTTVTSTTKNVSKNTDDKVTDLAFSFASVNYKPGYGIASWSAPNGHTTGKYFKTGTLLNVLAITDDHQWSKVTDVVTDQTGWVQTKFLKAQFLNQ